MATRFLVLLLVLVTGLDAANVCVRNDVTFDGDGTTWAAAASGGATGARKGIPGAGANGVKTALTRGNTYYVADGSPYSGFDCNTAPSSTTLIVIKKATIADHGTATGWSDTMGDGQAEFTNDVVLDDSYMQFDGVSGDFGSSVPYGFKVNTGEGAPNAIGIVGTNCVVRYVEVQGISSLDNYLYTSGTTLFRFYYSTGGLMDHCYVHGGDTLISLETGTSIGVHSNGITVSNSYMQASRSTSGSFHSNVFFCTGVNGVTWYNNYAFNYNDEGFFCTFTEGAPSNVTIYNSIFWGAGGPSGTTNPRGIEIRQGDSGTGFHTFANILSYGNTFVDLGSGGFLNRANEGGFGSSTGCAYTNNLEYASAATLGDTASVLTNTTAGSSSLFVGYAGGNFHLTADTANGTTLSAPYNVDKDGVTRPSGGFWDRGAYQFNTGGGSTGGSAISGKISLLGKVTIR